MKLFESLRHAVLPAPGNTYRPHLLRKSALTFFVAVILVAEGFVVAGAYSANPSHYILAAVAEAPSGPSSANSAVRTFARVASEPMAWQWVLGGAAAVLGVLLLLTVLVHARIQPTDLLLPGVAVFALAAFLLWCNAALLMPAQGDNALAAPTPAQYHW